MSAFIIGAEQREELNRLRQHAEAHKIEVDELLDIFNGQLPPVGDRKGFSCNIPVGYRVVFCIEFQKKGWAKHMSVSLHSGQKKKPPHPTVIKELMLLLGFTGKMDGKDVMVYFESEHTVVNVIEYIK